MLLQSQMLAVEDACHLSSCVRFFDDALQERSAREVADKTRRLLLPGHPDETIKGEQQVINVNAIVLRTDTSYLLGWASLPRSDRLDFTKRESFAPWNRKKEERLTGVRRDEPPAATAT